MVYCRYTLSSSFYTEVCTRVYSKRCKSHMSSYLSVRGKSSEMSNRLFVHITPSVFLLSPQFCCTFKMIRYLYFIFVTLTAVIVYYPLVINNESQPCGSQFFNRYTLNIFAICVA